MLLDGTIGAGDEYNILYMRKYDYGYFYWKHSVVQHGFFVNQLYKSYLAEEAISEERNR